MLTEFHLNLESTQEEQGNHFGKLCMKFDKKPTVVTVYEVDKTRVVTVYEVENNPTVVLDITLLGKCVCI